MKNRVLLAGRNKGLIEELLNSQQEDFEFISTSSHPKDLESHINLVVPKIFLYCMSSDSSQDNNAVADLRNILNEKHIFFGIVGSKEDFGSINRLLPYKSDFEIERPAPLKDVFSKLKESVHDQTVVDQSAANNITVQKTGKHILVIDDDPIMLRLIKEQLHDYYDIGTANGGKVALKFLETKKTDLILLDYEMPDIDGPTVFTLIKQQEKLRDIPIVFLTGIKDLEKVKRVLALRPQGYILKPIDKEKLMEMVHKILG